MPAQGAVSGWRAPNRLLLAATLAALAAGGAAWLGGAPALRDGLFLAATAMVLAVLAVSIVRALRRGERGVDLVAALALLGAVLLGEFLAGAVIALMYASGRALEEHAEGRARRELSALLARAPRTCHRYRGATLEEVPVAAVIPGERVLVRAGEVVPVDGLVLGAPAVLDESALTGESRPVTRAAGDQARSGTVNAGAAFDLRVLHSAERSTYAGVVRLVAAAQREKAPFVRLADRYALLFVPLSLAVAGLAWLLSGDPVRALAVLVVATPCPLILAAPVAIVAGISRAARRGILVKGGGALETLARARVLILDKTGTLTTGRARLTAVEPCAGHDPLEVLRLAASLDQASQHVMAAALVRAARERGLELALPEAVDEHPGAGLSGRVEGRAVLLGSYALVASRVAVPADARRILRRMAVEGASGVFLAVDGVLAGALLLADELRPDTPRALRTLRRAGIERILMVSGDREDVAETIAAALGLDAVLAERSPAEKVEAVRSERGAGVTLMVGDGINDAPALAAADVGVAMGARGAGASSEAADAVLLVDRLDRLTEALHIARRSRGIALQSVIAGMALSLLAMGVAAFGWLVPVAGALVQEAIDVAVILNALRALGTAGARSGGGLAPETARRLAAEHRALDPLLDRIRNAADRLDTLSPPEARRELLEVDRILREELLPHEAADDAELYPRLAEAMGGDDPLGAMSRTHREIHHLARLYGRMVGELSESGPEAGELPELRRLLYGLAAILRLHFAQEEEIFDRMAQDAA